MSQYSQYGQDSYIKDTFFKNTTKGFFIDIGAYDGVVGSNTLLFEKNGWDGICVEPNPKMYAQLRENRKCTTLSQAISLDSSPKTFFQIEGYSEMLSGLADNYSQNHIARINREIEEHNQDYDYLEVECVTFSQLTEKSNIDYLSLDIEGNELEILKSIDFTQKNISVISVEANTPQEATDLNDFLSSRGFSCNKIMGVDLIFVNNSYVY